MKLHLDFETASNVDLAEVGLMNYVTHPSTRVLLAAWAIDDGPIEQASYEEGFTRLAQLIDKGLAEKNLEIHAWNAPFEWAVMRYVRGWDTVYIDHMYCTMAHALYRAFPAKLDSCAAALGIPGKPKDATRLLTTWCEGKHRPKPGDWERFCDYNRNDVAIERAIAKRLEKHPWPAAEREVWLMGEKVNWRGAPIDVRGATMARSVHENMTAAALQVIKSFTGVDNPNSTSQLAKWLGVSSLAKEHLPKLIESSTGERRKVLELRRDVALSAPKKFDVAVRQNWHGRLFNMLQYSGAGRTHRWSGRALQPQNLRRGPKDDALIAKRWATIMREGPMSFEDLADCVRSVIVPDEGKLLAVADYSSIEVVMLHWLAQDDDTLEAIRNGADMYKSFASEFFKKAVTKVTGDERTFAKPVVLGSGYGLGSSTLVEYAKGYGVDMSEETATRAVFAYRDMNPRVVSLWYGLEGAMTETIETGKGKRFGRIGFTMRGGACVMHLPSGTEITYWDAQMVPGKRGLGLSYVGVNQFTGHWERIRTWGSRLVENAVQSISRDVLVHGLRNAVTAGLDVVLHVHDEIVVETRRGDAELNLKILTESMHAPAWCADAPIKAEGWICPRYRKN
jgi:DNA polymerase bacteriophage-type